MKIYLQYPWKFPDSPYYKYLVNSPPKEISYLNIKRKEGVITNSKKFWILTRLKVNLRKWTNILNLPLLNIHKTKTKEDYDLIHCAHCLSNNKNKSWVADIESIWSMWISGMNTSLGRKKAKKILKRKNCKKILPWTENTEKEFLKIFPELKYKLERVYPAVPLKNIKRNKRNKRITITFIGRDFRLKGGIIALESFKKIKKEHPALRLVCVSKIPSGIKKKYPEIEIYDLLSHKKIEELFSETDIFLYPSLMDTFGFALLEAMSFGIPIIAAKTFLTNSLEEIITHKKNGYVVPFEFTHRDIEKKGREKEKAVNKIVEYLNKLIKNPSLRRKMSKECIEIIQNGKFSIKQRNNKLSKIYAEAII